MSENGHWRGPHMSAMLRLRADRRAGTPLASDKRMSVASIEKEDVVPPTSGSGMDRVVAKKGLPTRLKIAARSEEHTSELQSLMRISYAAFCLQKKTTNNTHKEHN